MTTGTRPDLLDATGPTGPTGGAEPGPAGGEPAGGTGGAWLLVARREVVVKLTDRAFVLGTLATLAVLVGLICVQAWLEGRTTTYDVAVSTPAAERVATEVGVRAPDLDDGVAVRVRPVADDAAATAALEDEEADAWLRPATEEERDAAEGAAGAGYVLVTRDAADAGLRSVVESVVREVALAENAATAGTSVESLTAGTGLAVEQLEGDQAESELQGILGFAFAMLFYLASLLFGYTLASSVLEEKQSRLAEMIAAAVPLRQLLAGKVLGNTALALGQITVYVVVGLVGLSFTEYGGLVAGVSGAIGWFLLFFLAGFVALACLWAVAGALASRSEDLQSTATPVTTLVLAIFFGALLLEGPPQTVASFVPPLSAVLMPMRLVEGQAAWWEALLALGALVALGAALVVVAERLYRRALLQTQGRLSIREAWRVEE